MKRQLKIAHLYPAEMNIYGDRGNVITLTKRAQWRGIETEVIPVRVGEKMSLKDVDIIFSGGGQDKGQVAVGVDLATRSALLQQLAADGVAMLTICGTYQLFGRGFTTLEGQEIPGISLFKAYTQGSTKRMIGNIVTASPFGQLVGFENHSGQTFLEPEQAPLGQVAKGFGNNGDDGSEGAMMNNVFGTYLHGPILPKNPHLADTLLSRALARKYGDGELEPLDDDLERAASRVASSRPA